MEASDDIRARHAETLAELNSLGLAMARDLAQRELAAETPKDAAQLAGAFHKITRSLRQTMALEDKLRREASVRDAVAKPTPPRPETRYDRIRDTVSRLIWDEYEDDEDEAYDLEDQLDDILEQDFPDIPEEDIAAQIAEHLGLKDPPLQGELSAKPTEGVEAHEPRQAEVVAAQEPESPAPQPPQSGSADSSPIGEQLEEPDPGSVRASWHDIFCADSPFGHGGPLPGELPPWEEAERRNSS